MTRPARGKPPAGSLIQRVKHAAAQQMPQQRPIRPADVDRRSDDIDRQYWRGSSPTPVRKGFWPMEDDQLLKIPTKQMEPVGEDAPMPVWMTGSQPAWNEPNFWSKPFEYTFVRCVPTWEQEYNIGQFQSPEMGMTVIQSVSYEVISGLTQFDLFEFKMYSGGSNKATWEDMTIDPFVATPARRYVFSGDTIPLPLTWRVDRDKICRFTVKARGLVDLAGVSNHAPGDPINPNAHFRLNVQGYIATLRRNVDGAPRPDDLGLMENSNIQPSPEQFGVPTHYPESYPRR